MDNGKAALTLNDLNEPFSQSNLDVVDNGYIKVKHIDQKGPLREKNSMIYKQSVNLTAILIISQSFFFTFMHHFRQDKLTTSSQDLKVQH